MNGSDAELLAKLYLASYPSDVVADLDAAREEMVATFNDDYGRLDLAASPVIERDGSIVAAVMTVIDAPWPDTPKGPFIVEVFVDPSHRRRGLAEFALRSGAVAMAAAGHRSVGLRVLSANENARALYDKLGFELWTPEAPERI